MRTANKFLDEIRQMPDYLSDIYYGYLEAALWSSTVTVGPNDVERLGLEWEDTDIHEEEKAEGWMEVESGLDAFMVDEIDDAGFDEAQRTIDSFLSGAPDDWDEFWEPELLGHDLWLTQNGHGAGFWDRYTGGREEELGEELSELAKAEGEAYVMSNNDGTWTLA